MKKIKEAQQLLDKITGSPEVSDNDRSRLNVLRQILEQKQKVLQGYDEEILDLCPVAAIDKEIDEADEANSNIVEILDKISDKLVAKPAPQIEGISDSPLSVGPSHIQQVNQATTVKSKLPKLALEKFRGDVTTFQSFWEQFNSTIHENASIPETDKFKHLKSLLDGPAARVVQGLTLTSANYKHARELLKDRYGRTQVIISALMDNVLKLNPCTSEKPHQLRYLYGQIRVQIRGLEALGVMSQSIPTGYIPPPPGQPPGKFF